MASLNSLSPNNNKPRLFYGYFVVTAAFIILMVSFGVNNAFGVFFNPILTEFGWTRAMTSGAFSLSWVMQGVLGIMMGGLNDRFGPRVVITICGLLMGAGFMLMSRVYAIWHIYLFYGIIVGVGMGGVMVSQVSTIAKWFVKRRSMMTGIVMNGIGLGILIAPPIANQLISTNDWRVSYIILGGVVLVAVVLAAQLLRRDPSQVGQLPYGDDRIESHQQRLTTNAYSLNQAVRTRQFWAVFIILFSFGFCRHSIMVHLVAHAIGLGISDARAAFSLAIIGAGSIVGRILFGNIADRIGIKRVFIICYILMSISLISLVPATDEWQFYLFACLFGLAWGSSASESPVVAWLFGLRSHGLIFGVIGLGFTIGAAIGPFVTGYIYDVTNSYTIAFVVCVALSIIGLIASASIRPINKV